MKQINVAVIGTGWCGGIRAETCAANPLVKDLHDSSTQNREFLAARFAPADSSAALETYKQRIVKCFFPTRGHGAPKLREARAVIRQYQKATADLVGTLDLMLAYVESGTAFTSEYGDIDEPFYDSLSSVLGEIEKYLISPEGVPSYPRFEERLAQLRHDAHDIGWGHGDEVSYCVQQCEKAHAKWARANPTQPETPDW